MLKIVRSVAAGRGGVVWTSLTSGAVWGYTVQVNTSTFTYCFAELGKCSGVISPLGGAVLAHRAFLARTSRFIDCYGERGGIDVAHALGAMYLYQKDENSTVENCDLIRCNASEGSSIYALGITPKC